MKRSVLLLSSVTLLGCETAWPDIALDAAPMRPAKVVNFDDGRPVREVVETAKPYPLPGQLKPVEEEEPSSPELKPFERIDTANERAKIEPDLTRFVNAVQVYPFMEGALYRLYAAPEQVTDIALEPGERLNSVSAGDTVRWVVGDTSSGGAGGSGVAADERVHILVKPIAPGLSTNLVIATDRRAYHLEMRSFRETYMAAISWTYPQGDLVKRRNDAERSNGAVETVVAAGVDPGDLKFRYEIEGDRPHWRPVRAFDNGEQVFIQFPDAIAQGEAPPLFVLSRDGKPELVNYRMRGNYYVVDRLFAAAELRLGEKRQDVVRIIRSDLKRRS
ncbi:MAG: P-type conjugative transfer protein TrbG [Parvularculaceae bacterium]